MFLLLLWVSVAFVFGGIEWTATMKTIGKKKHTNNDISTHTYAQKGDVKQVFEGVANENPMYTQNGYWLFKADESDIYIVDDNKKQYMVMNLDSLLQMAGMMGQLVKITVKDHTVSAEELPAQKVLGYDCNHVKITTEYTMKVKIAFIKKTMKIHEVKEIWGTNKIPGLDEIGKSFMNKDFRTGIEDLDEMIKKEMEQQQKIGFPIKMITKRKEMNKKGKVKNTITTTMEVKEIKSKNFPKAFFEVPAEYDRVDMPGSKGLKGMFK
jgi:hypothetical protein